MGQTRLEKLRFYAEQEPDGTWFGICIDLNLAAHADSMEDVRAKLHEYVVDYLDEAYGEDRKYLDDLVPRLAPLPFRFRYYWLALRQRCRVAAGQVRACRFTERFPTPLKPA